jgi:hypothetical protein
MKRIPLRCADRKVANLLEEQEKIIRDRIHAIEEVASAFRTIREEKLYRLTYRTFDDYCKAVWGFGKDKAYRLIKHADISYQPGSSMSQNATTSDTAGSKLDHGSEADDKYDDEGHGDYAASAQDSKDRSRTASQTSGGPTTDSDPVMDDAGQQVPDRLFQVFEDASRFRKAAALLNRAATSLKEIELTAAYQIAAEEARKRGGERRDYASACLTVARRLEDWCPAIVCPVCTGANEPSPDNDACSRCNDKGYLTVGEIEK